MCDQPYFERVAAFDTSIDNDSLASQLASTDVSSPPDDKARITLLIAARIPLRKVDEKAVRLTMREPHPMTGFRVALEMKLFEAIGDEQKTCHW